MKKIINTLLALSLAGCSSQAVVTPTVKPTNTAQPAVTQEVQPIEEVELPSLESTCTIWDTIENDLETEIDEQLEGAIKELGL